MVKIGNNLIVNTDNKQETQKIINTDCVVLTCGLKLNSTVTASSINEDGLTFCLQRNLKTLTEKTVSPQEFNIKWFKKPDDIFDILSFVTALLLCDVEPKVFETIQF